MTKKKQTAPKAPQKSTPENSPDASADAPSQLEAGSGVAGESAFPIVGIGASAGGLKAFEAFFKAMPPNVEPGMAFVLVQHLAPTNKSLLADLIQNYTPMRVFEIEDGMVVAPNCIYIIPPNADLALFDGKLHLLEQTAVHGIRLPIDFFFRTLAQNQHERAIAIVLSGTGSDGTQGVRAIKAEGGLVIVQTPESTEYDGMPRSAIATNLVDYVLPLAEMPTQLLAYADRAYGTFLKPVQAKKQGVLPKIFISLQAQTGHDFSHYKTNTVSRRIERRMAVQHIDTLEEYARFLRQTPVEVDALFHDLLINVTRFFRDPEAFNLLESAAIPQLFANKPPGATIRIWVPGCSTGEEAYSIAILLQEQMEALRQNFKVQLFATDIDHQAIALARLGTYPSSIAADVSPERLARFFSQNPDKTTYRIQKNIRDMLIFSEQNLIQDPPFSKLDLISCRNLLIYLNGSLQKKLMPLFHYALAPGGLLFLGNSESIGEHITLFTPLDRKWKLYERQDDSLETAVSRLSRFSFPGTISSAPSRLPFSKAAPYNKLSLRDLTEQALLAAYAPGSALVNAQGEILYIYGRTGQFLEPTPGVAEMNILLMAREGLRQPLTVALHQIAHHLEPVVKNQVKIRLNSHFITVNLTVRPLQSDQTLTTEEPLFLVTLEEVTSPVEPTPATAVALDLSQNPRIQELEEMLRAKEDYLLSTREEMNTANEELKSTNEELQSVNEELQSTNEELETSKEELQSLNEELSTVNAELQQKVSDLSRANNDMNNLLAGTGVGTIFVDHQLCILRFTPSATHLINLIQTDIGRPVHHLMTNLVGYNQLASDIHNVLNTLVIKEIEVQTTSSRWYLLNIRPYRTLENVIEGAVITFVDISRLKEAESMARLAAVVRDSPDAITVQDLQGKIVAWNPAAERIYGWSEKEGLQLTIRDRIPAELYAEELVQLKKLGQSVAIPPYETQRLAKDGRIINVLLTATALKNEAGLVYAIAITEREIVSKE